MKNVKPGQIVEMTFLDHCMHHDEHMGPMKIRTFGLLIKVTKQYYTLASWIETNGRIDSNTEMFTIVKSAVSSIKVLK